MVKGCKGVWNKEEMADGRWAQAHAHACTRARTHACTRTRKHARAHAHIYADTHTCVYMTHADRSVGSYLQGLLKCNILMSAYVPKGGHISITDASQAKPAQQGSCQHHKLCSYMSD